MSGGEQEAEGAELPLQLRVRLLPGRHPSREAEDG
jgi:hypothetical protein